MVVVGAGLQLLDVISFLKREEKDADLSIQFEVRAQTLRWSLSFCVLSSSSTLCGLLQVFSVQKHRDETELMGRHGLADFNSHQDLFLALYSAVSLQLEFSSSRDHNVVSIQKRIRLDCRVRQKNHSRSNLNFL